MNQFATLNQQQRTGRSADSDAHEATEMASCRGGNVHHSSTAIIRLYVKALIKESLYFSIEYLISCNAPAHAALASGHLEGGVLGFEVGRAAHEL